MNKDKEFKSGFKMYLEAFYHDHRATHGTSISLFACLHAFDTYLFRIGFNKPYFLKEDYEAWLKTMPHNKPITIKNDGSTKILYIYVCNGYRMLHTETC